MAGTQYPEHEKLNVVKERSQAIGDFVSEFLQQKGVVLATYHEHEETCTGKDGFKQCGYHRNELEPLRYQIEDLLAEYFGVNRKNLDAEKDAMLKEMREASKNRFAAL